MQRDDLQMLLVREPFPLLRLHLAGGMVFDITDPDSVYLSFSTVELLLPRQHNQQREAVISLDHIVWVEILDPPN